MLSYLAIVKVLATHEVFNLSESKRFVDYAMGVFPGFETRNSVKTGIKRRAFLLNGEMPQTGSWVKTGDRIELLQTERKPKAYHLRITILFEDDYLAIVFKPAGLVVSGNQFKTLENCLVDQIIPKGTDALNWALPVHRLDAQTSGLVLFAKTHATRRLLGEMLEQRRVQKEYHAVVHGTLADRTIDIPVDGKSASSKVKLIRTVPSLKNETLSLVKLYPETGRTHQLRIHCASEGNPIVGDKLYGNEHGTFTHKGLFLSATGLQFSHPVTNQSIDVKIEIPEKFASLLNRETARWSRTTNEPS